MTLSLCGTRIEYNQVNAFGSAIFFVNDDQKTGSIVIDSRSSPTTSAARGTRNTRRFLSSTTRRPQSPIRPYSEWTGDLRRGRWLRPGCTAEMKVTLWYFSSVRRSRYSSRTRPAPTFYIDTQLCRRVVPAGRSRFRHPRSSAQSGRQTIEPDAHAVFAAQAVLDDFELQRAHRTRIGSRSMRCRS